MVVLLTHVPSCAGGLGSNLGSVESDTVLHGPLLSLQHLRKSPYCLPNMRQMGQANSLHDSANAAGKRKV